MFNLFGISAPSLVRRPFTKTKLPAFFTPEEQKENAVKRIAAAMLKRERKGRKRLAEQQAREARQ
jgi:hypothetical protein